MPKMYYRKDLLKCSGTFNTQARGELGACIRRIMVTTAINYLKRRSHYHGDLSFTEVSIHPVSADNPIVKPDAKNLADIYGNEAGTQLNYNISKVFSNGYSWWRRFIF